MIILGIDPGFARLGYCILDNKIGILKCLAYGCIQTSKEDSYGKRCTIIRQEISILIKKFRPDVIGLERLFFGRNVDTALEVAGIRAIVLQLCYENRIDSIYEPYPIQVKAGLGIRVRDKKQNRDKGLVQQQVKLMLGMSDIMRPDDAADAAAIAIWTEARARINALIPV